MFGKDFREDAASAQNVAAMLQIEDEVHLDLRPRERQMGPSSLRRTSWASSWMARILLFGFALEIRNLQHHFAGKQQRGDRALEFVS